MELKSAARPCSILRRVRFNRTFMELKYITSEGPSKMKECFNRTFMELKSRNS